MEKTGTLNQLFFRDIASRQTERLLTWNGPDGPVTYSNERFVRSVLALQAFLRGRGLDPQGERVAIFSPNRPEWHVADFAVLLARHVVVPIYPTLSPAQVEYLLRDSGSRVIVLAGIREWELLQPLLPRLPQLRWFVHLDRASAGSAEDGHVSLEHLAAALEGDTATVLEQARQECLATEPSEVATIVYTSGTTASPKGVLLTHGNIAFDLDECLDRLSFRGARQSLSVLPLAHVFERILCYGYFRMGIPIAYGDPHALRELLPLHRPEVMGCVPRILEKMRDAIERQIEELPRWKRRIGKRLLRERPVEEPPGLLDRLAAGQVRRQLGGLRYFICGGAWLNPAVEAFFRSAEFRILQGYGMTETSPVIALSELDRFKPGSVGRPLDHIELRIAADGEIETRGPHVMRGYYNDSGPPPFRDGWLATGDLGRLDEDGFLFVTGRKKDMLVLSNGKKVFSAELEKSLARSRLIQDVFVIGEGRNYVAAVIVPDEENLARAIREQNIRSSPPDLLSPAVVALFREEVERNQASFSNFERVKRFCFLPEQALLDPELITPTQKMRRRALEEKFRDAIVRVYESPEPFLIPVVPGPPSAR
jgi:long-chain acyl-CoA synthetase